MTRLFGTTIICVCAAAMALCTGCSKKSDSADRAPAQPPPKKLAAAPRSNAPARKELAAAAPAPAVAATAPATAAAAEQPTTEAAIEPPDDPGLSSQAAAMRKQYGIVVLDVAANQYTVDVQFMVQQPEKAGPVLYSTASRRLIDQKSGTELLPLQASSSRSRRGLNMRPKMDSPPGARCYYATFDNTAGVVKPGDKVSLVVDQWRVDDLTVQQAK